MNRDTQQASEPADAAAPRLSTVEKIARGLEKRAADIRQGLRYLPSRGLTPHEAMRQRLMLASKLQRIERKIFVMRQGRLL